MIHVDAQTEPESFNSNVRQKGLAWLIKKNIPLDKPLAAFLLFNFNIAYNEAKTKKIDTCEIGGAAPSTTIQDSYTIYRFVWGIV